MHFRYDKGDGIGFHERYHHPYFFILLLFIYEVADSFKKII